MRAELKLLVALGGQIFRWCGLLFGSTQRIQAENLFLRRQLALYVERGVKPRRIDFATRLTLTLLSHLFNWRDALVVVQPETMIRWHRAGWKLFWRFKSRAGRPPIPRELQALIRRMGNENPSWGEERIANELLLKIGIRVSPRTVNKYLPRRRTPGRPRGDLRWSTFLRLHAHGIIACDCFVAVSATFRLLYVFVVIEHRSRRLVHCNVTAHPSSAWTLQQLREAVGVEGYKYLLHDRDSIFARHMNESIGCLGVTVLKSPPRSPKANAVCERVIGTIRRECLDWLIPLSETHLRHISKSWIPHYNATRPHMSLGPGVPDPPRGNHLQPRANTRHRGEESYTVRANSI
jgi:putative transposase